MEHIVVGGELYELFRANAGWMVFSANVSAGNDHELILSNIDYKPMHTRQLRVSVKENSWLSGEDSGSGWKTGLHYRLYSKECGHPVPGPTARFCT
jgi:hypothetical protein